MDGVLHLAAGVTSVRDLANDADSLLARVARFDQGTEIGPRVVLGGIMDGPGPLAGPTKVLVETPAEARKWVDWYADHGYAQVKIYSSIKPELVPVIAHASGRGRISYAELGIGELGAVYEGLLRNSGFFAKETLVRGAQGRRRHLGRDPTELLPARARAVEVQGRGARVQSPRCHGRRETERRSYAQGTFVFRLAGRDREQSASYYTPQVLTRCLVKFALKELLPGKSADEMLQLSICEPAMGSGAFLVEAVDQLADAYLEKKQVELGVCIGAKIPEPNKAWQISGLSKNTGRRLIP